MAHIRPDEPGDLAGILHVLHSAFATEDEARTVSLLRESGHLSISLVAEEAGRIIGYIAFSPVTTDGVTGGLGLAPVAVHPVCQNQGIGGELVEAGLAAARQYGAGYVVVLGHAHYYPRFGFQSACNLGYHNEFNAEESFMIMELEPGALPKAGTIKYGPEFARWS